MIYLSLADINIYDSPKLDRLSTQMAKGRYLQVLESEPSFLKIKLLEDDYEGLLDRQDLDKLAPSDRQSYLANLPPGLNAVEISDRLPAVIAYIQQAMATPNEYLWGGTTAPNYDCSGLMQSAFASVGVWIPRDAYQQEDFGTEIPLEKIQIGDLVFFGKPKKATHVGLYIGNGEYIHSSGKEHGHNGITISKLSGIGSGLDPVSQWYSGFEMRAGRLFPVNN
jgi:hypothetical protein